MQIADLRCNLTLTERGSRETPRLITFSMTEDMWCVAGTQRAALSAGFVAGTRKRLLAPSRRIAGVAETC